MKRALLIIGFVIVVCILIVSFSKDRIIKFLTITTAERITGAPVSINSFSLNIFDHSVEIKGFKLHNPPGFVEGLILDIPKVNIKYDLSMLLKGKLHLPFVTINLREVGIVKNKDGKFNVDLLKAVERKKEFLNSEKNIPVQIDMLRLSIGVVIHKDYSHGKETPTIHVYDLNIKDRYYKNIPSIQQLIILLLKKSMERTAIEGAEIYGVAALAGIGFWPAGAVVLLTAKDSFTADFDIAFDKAYDTSLEVAKKIGRVLKENKNRGIIKAGIYHNNVTVKTVRHNDKTTKITVAAKRDMIPHPQIAEEVLYEILEKIESDK